MYHYFSLILLAFTLSLDSCSVGLTYGLRNVRIPLKSILIIGVCSAAVMLISMGLGHMIAKIFSPVIATRIGGFVLIAIGAWVLYQFFRSDKKMIHSKKRKFGNWKLLRLDWLFKFYGNRLLLILINQAQFLVEKLYFLVLLFRWIRLELGLVHPYSDMRQQ